jgi:CheY-like chemotaxis protein
MATLPATQRSSLPCRILLVDDNEDAVTSLRMLLELEGHAVAVADSGHRAIELTRSFAPHIALIGIGLPDMDGYAVARRIRAEHWGNEVFLIALTGWVRSEDRANAIAAGFDLHVAKPVDFVALDNILNQFECSGRTRASA